MTNANGTGILYVDFQFVHINNEGVGGDTYEITTQENFAIVKQAVVNGSYVVARYNGEGVGSLFMPLVMQSAEADILVFGNTGGYTIDFTPEGCTLNQPEG